MSFRELTAVALDNVLETFKDSQKATYTKYGSGPAVTAELDIVFDENFESIDPETGVPVSARQYSALVKLSELPAGCPQSRDTLARADDSKTYTVIDWQSDGHGGLLLILQS